MSSRVLFFTYYRLVPTGQIGVFKRCMRLIGRLPDDIDVHLVNYGPLPDHDTLFSTVRGRLTVHDPGLDDLGSSLRRLLEDVRPDAVVHGEAPLRGNMRLSYRVASAMGLHQLAIDNYYGDYMEGQLAREFPHIDRWLLLGLMDRGVASRHGEHVDIIPPLVKFPPGHGRRPRDRVLIVGYDRQTLVTGLALLERLPPSERVDIIITPEWQPLLAERRIAQGRPGLRVLTLPGDDELYDSISQAKLVFGKAGFQQVVECVGMGAPIVCQVCGGGIELQMVPPYLRAWVRLVRDEDELGAVLFDVAGWLLQPASLVWSALGEQIPDPTAYGARRLAEAVTGWRLAARPEPAIESVAAVATTGK